jgi:hypothetical protein
MIIRKNKSRRMRWVEHVACMGKRRNLHKILIEKPEGKRLVRISGHRWRVILEWILEK